MPGALSIFNVVYVKVEFGINLHIRTISVTQLYCKVLRGHTVTSPCGTVCMRFGTTTSVFNIIKPQHLQQKTMNLPASLPSVQKESTMTKETQILPTRTRFLLIFQVHQPCFKAQQPLYSARKQQIRSAMHSIKVNMKFI